LIVITFVRLYSLIVTAVGVIHNQDCRLADMQEQPQEDAAVEVSLCGDEENGYYVLDNIPDDIELLLIKYSVQYGLPLDVVIRLSEVESNHGEYIRSSQANFDGSFDIGVLALNSNYIEYFAERYFEGNPSEFDPYNPEHNIQTGLAYLAHLNSLTKGDITSAVTAYNCGYRSMLAGEIPSSTQRYVRAIIDGERL
jgi:soluble lytic murein transglycosylase-like protein